MFDIVQAVVVVCTYDDALHEVVDTNWVQLHAKFQGWWIIPDTCIPTTLAIRYNYGYRLNEKKTPQKQQQQQ